jgi:hypothetical protein
VYEELAMGCTESHNIAASRICGWARQAEEEAVVIQNSGTDRASHRMENIETRWSVMVDDAHMVNPKVVVLGEVVLLYVVDAEDLREET